MVANPILFQSPAMDMVALYGDLDDFYQAFAPTWHRHLLPAPGRHRQRTRHLSMSEMMTLVVAFQDSNYRTFKHFTAKRCAATGGPNFLIWSVINVLWSACLRCWFL